VSSVSVSAIDLESMQSPWQDVEMVDIKSGAPEFNEIVDLFYATCSRGEWRIVKIQRVQNLPQFRFVLYQTHKRTIEARNRPRPKINLTH
jgi:hypothetical protein